MPRELGASSTVQHRFQEWEQAGFFRALWQAGLQSYDDLMGIQWEWQAIDGTMIKAPFGYAATGPNPTDRSKLRTKRSLLTDGAGIPLAIIIAGAHHHEMKLLVATLEGIVVARPEPSQGRQQLCLDAGYDYPAIREEAQKHHYIPHIRSRRQEQQENRMIPGYRARRWVVERTHARDQSFPSAAGPLGEEGRELFRFPLARVRSTHLCQSSHGRLIASKAWCAKGKQQGNHMPSLQENKALVRRFFAALEDYCRGNETAFEGIVATSFRDSVLGTQGIQATIGPVKELFTDLRCLLNDLLAEDERVIAHVSFEFTHTKPFMGREPTHKRVQYVNVVALRIAQGQIVERMWNVANTTHLLRQLSSLSPDER